MPGRQVGIGAAVASVRRRRSASASTRRGAVVGIVVVIGAVMACYALLVRTGERGIAAPRLGEGFGPALLARAGFPATAHNLAALQDRLGVGFLAALRPDVDAPEWAALVARCEATRRDGGAWAQRVLDEIAAAGHASVTTLAHRCPEGLLATAGTGHGFFGGSVFAPLPTPPAGSDRLLATPSAPVVPAPRRATLPGAALAG